jgi:hypothetical protein
MAEWSNENEAILQIEENNQEGMNIEKLLMESEAALKNTNLQQAPRALILLLTLGAMLQRSTTTNEEIEQYWDQLKRVNSSLPDEFREEFNKLQNILEPGKEKKKKGFVAEALTQIATAEKTIPSNPDQAKEFLLQVEAQVRDRSWPMGKGPVQVALVLAWASIDRSVALDHIKEVPKKKQAELVKDLNKNLTFTPEEWAHLSTTLGEDQVHKIAWYTIGPDKTFCLFSEAMLRGLAGIMAKWVKGRFDVSEAIARLAWLMVSSSMIPEDRASVYAELFTLMANSKFDATAWLEKFRLLRELITLGVKLSILNDKEMENLIGTVPQYLQAYSQAHHLASIAKPETIESLYLDLKRKTSDDASALSWFLVWLVVRGYAQEALEMAQKSENHEELSQRVRRAWLCLDREGARHHLHAEDFVRDPVGEFLCQKTVEARADYLRHVTNGGTRPLPGPMWVVPRIEEVKKGLLGRKVKPKLTFKEQAQEYLQRTPLYSYVPPSVQETDQFTEFLRVMGFGEYTYQTLDIEILEALLAWADTEPKLVHALLRRIWQEIQPDDFVLFSIPLSQAIFERCSTVLAADTSVLVDECAYWLLQEWVRKGRQDKSSGRDATTKLSDSVPLGLCLAAASVVDRFSGPRRDEILIRALKRLDRNPDLITSAARLYSTDKPLFEFTPPLELKKKEMTPWQLGVVLCSFASLNLMLKAAERMETPKLIQPARELTDRLPELENLEFQRGMRMGPSDQIPSGEQVAVQEITRNLQNLKRELFNLPKTHPTKAFTTGAGVAQAQEQIPIICRNIEDAIKALQTGRDPKGNPITKHQITDGLKQLIAETRRPAFIGLLSTILDGYGIEHFEQLMAEFEQIAERISQF